MDVSQATVSLDDGQTVKVMTVFTAARDRFILKRDPRLEAVGMVTDAGGMLIDQKATATMFFSTDVNSLAGANSPLTVIPAGQTPDEFAKNATNGSLVIPVVDHWGWQNGCTHLQDGHKIKLPKDRLSSGGYFILNDQRCWAFSQTASKIHTVLGFSATLMVDNGKLAAMEQLLGTPRIVADARNVYVFNSNHIVPAEFFQLIRPLLPTTTTDMLSLWQGDRVVVKRSASSMPEADYERLQEIIDECQLDHLVLSRSGSSIELEVIDRLPRQRMPLTGVGIDTDQQLMIVVVDGRQPDSAGMTIEELAAYMLSQGAVYASLGGGGGDSLIGQVVDGRVLPRNIPSNKKDDGTFGAMRRSPNALLIRPW